MEINLYSVFDVKAGVFQQPIFVINDAVAIRSFDAVVKDKSHEIGKYPSDYSLYHIGVFDTDSGHIYPGRKDSNTNPTKVIDGLSLAGGNLSDLIHRVQS